MKSEPIVHCHNLVKIYKIADLEVIALQGLDLEISPGEIIALVGPSGAGKSTLLNLIGGLDLPSAGRLTVSGENLLAMTDSQRVTYKRNTVGFVWQQPSRNLLPYLSARENVELPMILHGTASSQRRQRASDLLKMVMLEDREEFRPDRLSGGQQQRVALAIALANTPPILLADELTGQVDSEAAAEIFKALRLINRELGTTIIIVTHDPQIASRVDRVVAVRDGRTSTEVRRLFDKQGKIDEEEWVILDGVGRLQLPKGYIDTLNLRERVKVRLEGDHVTIWPAHSQVPLEEKDGAPLVWKPPSMQSFLRSLGDDPYEADSAVEDRPVPPEIGSPSGTLAPTVPGGLKVQTRETSRTFQFGGEEIHACKDISLVVQPGSIAVLKGRSGSGKTTLLNLIAGLDEPTNGEIILGGRSLAGLSNRERIDLRRNEIGFVYQTFGLLPYLSAGENIEIPLRMVRTPRVKREARVREVLGIVGLSDRINHRTYELSGGEQQRVAIGRALVNSPSLILADEPTGQLDTATGLMVINLLQQVVKETGVTLLLASHDPNVHQVAETVFEMVDGKLARTYQPGIE